MSLAPAKRTPKAKRNVIEISYPLYEGTGSEDGEEIHLIIRPGENGVTELDISNYYKTEESYVYHDTRCCNVERWMSSDERRVLKKAKKQAAQEKANSMLKEHGCYLTSDAMQDFEDAQFDSWPCISLEELCEGTGEDELGDKARVLAGPAWQEPEKNPAEERLDEIVSTFPETWKTVYQRVLLDGETLQAVANDLGVSKVRVYQLTQQIKEKIKKDSFLQKIFF